MLQKILSVLVYIVAVLLVSSFSHAQTCTDHDGDGEQFGFSCPTSTDCNDRLWSTNSSAPETCDGIDNNCDDALDEGCLRTCAAPNVSPYHVVMPHSTHPDEDVQVAVVDQGLLVFRMIDIGLDGLGYASLYDRKGQPLGPMYLIGDGDNPEPIERRPYIVSGGDRALLLWTDFSTGVDLLRAVVVDQFGKPIGTTLDITATEPASLGYPNQGAWDFQGVAWDGERFAIFWNPDQPRNALLITFVDAEGELVNPEATIVTEDIDGTEADIGQITGIWSGQRYIITASHSEAPPYHRFITTDRDGNLISNTPPDFQEGGGPFKMVRSETKVVAFWEARILNRDRLYAQFMNPDGSIDTSDKAVRTIYESPDQDEGVQNPQLAWSGEQFLSIYSTETLQFSEANWFGIRFLEDGTVLDSPPIPLRRHQATVVEDLTWSGERWHLWARREDTPVEQIAMHPLDCDCSDVDGDGVDACLQQDCNDHNPLAFPGGIELCSGGDDEDCDGAYDCDDSDCAPSVSIPTSITDLRPNGDQWIWTDVTNGDRYDLARGRLSDLKRRGDFYQAECAGRELTMASWQDDGRNPAVGEVLWYLIRAESDPCSFSTWSEGTPSAEILVCR